MAAEVLANGGRRVDVYDAMPSVGRKFLLAGKGGLNLTHAEAHEQFLSRYGASRPWLEQSLDEFGADAVRGWAQGLGVETFVGTSGRVFPADMKAAPLLRTWLHRLRQAGVTFHMRHRWHGWDGAPPDAPLVFATPEGEKRTRPAATVLALGGASWPRLGSDGAWTDYARGAGRCGGSVAQRELWLRRTMERDVSGAIRRTAREERGHRDRWQRAAKRVHRRGEFVVTANGVEGGLIYACSAQLRDAIEAIGEATLRVDLAPDRSATRLANEVTRSRGSSSWSRHLERTIGLRGVKVGLLREVLAPREFEDTDAAGCFDQGAADQARRGASGRRSDQQRGWRHGWRARSASDAERVARRLLRGRDARLGSADRRLSVDGLLRHGTSRRREVCSTGSRIDNK